MAIFLVLARGSENEVAPAVEREFRSKHYRFTENIWFVIYDGTAKELAESLGVRRGGISGVGIMRGTPFYYGMASSDFWGWLKSAIEKEDNG